MLHAEGVKGNGKGYEFRQRLHIETSMLGGTILPNHSGHQIHPQQQILEARVVAKGVPGWTDIERDQTAVLRLIGFFQPLKGPGPSHSVVLR